MSRYKVVWLKPAQDQLAELWLKSASRSHVTSAASTIDRNLQISPKKVGAEISEGLRELRVGPLRILYSVDDDEKRVEVASVKLA